MLAFFDIMVIGSDYMKDIIGSHVSFTKDKQLLGSVLEALEYKSTTFMFYTGAPQNTNRANIDSELTFLAHNLLKKENINIDNIVVHAPYIINLANPKNYDFNIEFLREEIKRVEQLGVTKLVLHPGSHVGVGVDEGIKNIVNALNEVLTKDTNVIICLETMAGKGSEIGVSFEELKRIIDGVEHNDKVKVCFKDMTDDEIEKWIETGKAMDKAGAYAMQEEFGVFVEKIEGNYSTVVGLPIHKVYDIIKNYIGRIRLCMNLWN